MIEVFVVDDRPVLYYLDDIIYRCVSLMLSFLLLINENELIEIT